MCEPACGVHGWCVCVCVRAYAHARMCVLTCLCPDGVFGVFDGSAENTCLWVAPTTSCQAGDSLGFSVISGHKFVSSVGVWGSLLLQVPHYAARALHQGKMLFGFFCSVLFCWLQAAPGGALRPFLGQCPASAPCNSQGSRQCQGAKLGLLHAHRSPSGLLS